VPAESVALGQHVLVRPGEQVPLDGTITWGTANLSLQHISGEAQPVKLSPGQEVPAGVLLALLCTFNVLHLHKHKRGSCRCSCQVHSSWFQVFEGRCVLVHAVYMLLVVLLLPDTCMDTSFACCGPCCVLQKHAHRGIDCLPLVHAAAPVLLPIVQAH
jgi:hypothetical protein